MKTNCISLEVRDFHSGDISRIWDWTPETGSDVYFQLEVEIGERGISGGNLFQLIVASPEGIKSFAEEFGEEHLPNRALLIVLDYSWSKVRARIEKIVRLCEKDSWELSLASLQRYFIWEYEDLKRTDGK